MKKSVLGIIIAVAAVLAIIGVVWANSSNDPEPVTTTDTSSSEGANSANTNTDANNQQSQPDQNEVQVTEVEIKDFAFTPATITVKVGTGVKWTNRDTTQHNVVPDTNSSNFVGSEMLSKDASYAFKFMSAGTYKYHCGPHPQMTGTVIVTE